MFHDDPDETQAETCWSYNKVVLYTSSVAGVLTFLVSTGQPVRFYFHCVSYGKNFQSTSGYILFFDLNSIHQHFLFVVFLWFLCYCKLLYFAKHRWFYVASLPPEELCCNSIDVVFVTLPLRNVTTEVVTRKQSDPQRKYRFFWLVLWWDAAAMVTIWSLNIPTLVLNTQKHTNRPTTVHWAGRLMLCNTLWFKHRRKHLLLLSSSYLSPVKSLIYLLSHQ